MKPLMIVIAVAVLGIAVHVMISVNGSGSPFAANVSGSVRPTPVGLTRAGPERRFLAPQGVPADITRLDEAATHPREDSDSPSATAGRSFDDVRDRLEVFFNADPGGTAWTQGAVDTVTRSVHAVLPPGSQLQRIACHGALCRIETRHLDVDEFRAYTRAAFGNSGTRIGLGGAFVGLLAEPAPGNPVRAVSYLARDGAELPSLEVLFSAR